MWANALIRGFAWLISKPLWFIRFAGRENIPDPSFGGFIIAANHQTYADPAWNCIPVDHPLRFMAYDDAFTWRFVGPMIRALGAFPVGLEVGGTLSAMKEALRVLEKGAALVVFPEGEREFADGEIIPFKSGVVRIAMHAKVPILPVTIVGGNHIWPRDQKFPRLFRRVEITYHPMITVKENEALDLHENLEYWTAELEKTIRSAYRT